jgi:hypothetical protein
LKCGKCDKLYAVEADWKAHSQTCGTREYRCDCGELFSRSVQFLRPFPAGAGPAFGCLFCSSAY